MRTLLKQITNGPKQAENRAGNVQWIPCQALLWTIMETFPMFARLSSVTDELP